MYYLGIDGGGTRTVAAVSDEKGNILCRAESGSINFYSVGMDIARENLSAVVKKIENELGDIAFSGAFIGCSALDSEADDEMVKALCDGIIKADKIGMNSDAYVALRASDCRAVAICGTGSMAIGETEDGEIIVKGGWGHILGDSGSAYSVAINALKHCCSLSDCNGADDILFAACDYFGVSSFRDIIDIVYSPDTKKDYIAGFSVQVGRLAEEGRSMADYIIREEASQFAMDVMPLLIEAEEIDSLSVYGGMFRNSVFMKFFCDTLKEEYPDIVISELKLTPEEGALKLARAL